MNIGIVRSIQSEWLKKKRTAGAWLVVAGALFIPLILLVARIVNFENLYEQNTSADFWNKLTNNSWQFMAIFLLPMGVILATSLISQNEFRNNTWKQLHATPQYYSVIFFAKLSVILFMLLQFFVLFNIGIYLSGVVPGLFFSDIPYPIQSFPFLTILKISVNYFICCLPIVALQFLLSLQIRNFLIPLGAGIALLIAALIALSWKYGYVMPYSYCGIRFMNAQTGVPSEQNLNLWAFGYFVAITIVSYILYIRKKEKG